VTVGLASLAGLRWLFKSAQIRSRCVFITFSPSVHHTCLTFALRFSQGAQLLPNITGIRYAWGTNPCCPGMNRDDIGCPPAACPIQSFNSSLPAVPFWATIEKVRLHSSVGLLCVSNLKSVILSLEILNLYWNSLPFRGGPIFHFRLIGNA
jgi:hypothetical protein